MYLINQTPKYINNLIYYSVFHYTFNKRTSIFILHVGVDGLILDVGILNVIEESIRYKNST